VKTQTGAARIVEALEAAKVRCVFGLPGTQTLELFEALRRSRIRTVVATNELAASFMAGGWARMTGAPGVLLTIPGPGFTWSLTGVAEARLDSVALLQITGAPSRLPANKRFRQQELDQAAMVAPLVKGVIEADARSDPGLAVLEGLRLARSGEPGPVLLQVSSATLGRDHTGEALRDDWTGTVDSDALERICARMRCARRAILMVGQGTLNHADAIRTIAEQMMIPVLTTPAARGVLPEDHPLSFGLDAYSGRLGDVNELVESADLVLVIGCKLAHSGTGGFQLRLPADRLVHVDTSVEVLGANYPASLEVAADAGDVLKALLVSLSRSAWTEDELKMWKERLTVRETGVREPRVTGSSTSDARGFFDALRRGLPRDAVLVLDSGTHQILARRYYAALAPRGLLMPTGLQSMGFAIPTAIGAKLAEPDRPVVALVGDGGFAMTALELLTAVRERVSLVVVVFVDGAFGQIRLQQLANYGVSYGVSLESPDLGLLAQSIGVRHRVVGENDVEQSVRAAVGSSGITILEVRVGDSVGIRRTAAVARARGITRRVAGRALLQRLKKLISRIR
jgi:acetolactate synthase-1/2/3 large subunit